jgi:hypothetical protein
MHLRGMPCCPSLRHPFAPANKPGILLDYMLQHVFTSTPTISYTMQFATALLVLLASASATMLARKFHTF